MHRGKAMWGHSGKELPATNKSSYSLTPLAPWSWILVFRTVNLKPAVLLWSFLSFLQCLQQVRSNQLIPSTSYWTKMIWGRKYVNPRNKVRRMENGEIWPRVREEVSRVLQVTLNIVESKQIYQSREKCGPLGRF